MRLSTSIVLAITVMVLIVLWIGISATSTTFVLIFAHLELWGEVVAKVCLGAMVFLVCSGVFLALFFCITEIQIRRLRLVRYAPVFVKDIGDQFLIRIGARDAFERVTANQIWGPSDNEKGNQLAFC